VAETSDILLRQVDGGVTAAAGFSASGVAAGVRKAGRLDVAVIAADLPVPSAAVFTTNSVAAAPVLVSREHIASGLCRAVAVNAGNANACTGAPGLAAARAMAATAATALECAPAEIVVASTGVIGVQLPLDVVTDGIIAAVASLSADGGGPAAQAILTTDTFAKESACAVTVGDATYTVGGMAKGSGMIQPNMATMLAFVTTDAPLTSEACAAALRAATRRTFNRITVDSDTSTNDMCLLMASGAAPGAPGAPIGPDDPAFAAVSAAVHRVCGELARMIVRDGEGASKFIEVTVQGAESESDAEEAALSIANSPLFKTAIFGGDANWGRVAMAVGKSGAAVDPDRLEIVFAGITTCVDGTGLAFDEEAAALALAERDIPVVVDLHLGDASATVWTCDLTYEYVRINGEYRS
jgi:glutamate N-acetyltransferase/amino-acid N-acetyltransferase